jgi:chaperonin GroES
MAKLNLKPTDGYLLVEPLEAETKTAGGIYLPDTATEKTQKGKVLAIGGSTYLDGREVKSPAKIGDVVFYKESWGGKIKIEGKEYLFAKFDEILAIETK